MQLTILGCGASVGVPVIGCKCAVCKSETPKNKRTRASIFIEFDDGFRLLVDTSPDLRMQALRHDIATIDAIFFTHAHADHVHGIDDVRSFNINADKALPAYGAPECMEELKRRFPYVWGEYKGKFAQRGALVPHDIAYGEILQLSEKAIIKTFRQHHAASDTIGLRFGNIAYSTDLNAIPESSFPLLENLDVWILDCLRDGEAGSHLSLEKSLALIERVRPKRAILTHMNHELDYDALKKRLPPHIEPAYDGMEIHS